MKRINFLGSPMDVASMSETVALIRDRILRQEFTQHVVVNVAKLVNMRKDPELAQSVTECDIINIDGMGVVWGARFLGHQVPERVAGVTYFLSSMQWPHKNKCPYSTSVQSRRLLKKRQQ